MAERISITQQLYNWFSLAFSLFVFGAMAWLVADDYDHAERWFDCGAKCGIYRTETELHEFWMRESVIPLLTLAHVWWIGFGCLNLSLFFRPPKDIQVALLILKWPILIAAWCGETWLVVEMIPWGPVQH